MPLVLAVFTLEGFLILLLWGIWTVLNLWIWQKAKSPGNALMMGGAGLLTLLSLLALFGADLGRGYLYLELFGLIALTIGFYISIKPMVAAQIGSLGAKFKGATSPPPAATPPANPPPKP